MNESVLPEVSLPPESLSKLLGEEKIRCAHLWYEENIRLWEATIARLKEEAQLEVITRYEDKKKEIFDSLHRQFSAITHQCGDEIDEYVKTLSPAKQTNVAILRDPNLRRPSQTPSHEVNSSPTDNFISIFSTISEAIGNDLQAVVILADSCFLYDGKVYSNGSPIRLETRNPGRILQGTLTTVTTDEIEIIFKDGSKMKLGKEDLVSRKVIVYAVE